MEDSPFGSMMPLNLPKPRALPMPQVSQSAQQQQMYMPAMPAAQAAPVAQPQRSEFESLMSMFNGLVKQDRDDSEKKKADALAKSVAAQLAALKNATAEAVAAPREKTSADTGASGQGADMDDYMARNAKFESGANDAAVNPGSGATGTFQFLPSTWNWIAKEAPELGLTPEGMKDRSQQIKAMRYYTNKSVRTLEPILGRKPTGGELYLLHLLGHSGGPAVLSNLDAPITSTISEGAYRGNPFLKQYTTGHDLIAGLNKTFGGGKE